MAATSEYPTDKMQVARAFGKLILLGEHAVVYGVPALVVGIDRGLNAQLQPASQPGLRLLRREVEWMDSEPLAKAFRALWNCIQDLRTKPMAPHKIAVAGTLPPGVGLGFSAAAAVAIARALVQQFVVAPNEAQEQGVFEAAMAWERVFHGNPSGIDVAAAMQGGCLLYRRGEEPVRLHQRKPLCMCVGLSGVASSTKAMVEHVAEQHRRDSQGIGDLWAAVGGLVECARKGLDHGSVESLASAMNENAQILTRLGLSTPELDSLCALAMAEGALAAKLTGAGGGGSAVVLVGEDSPLARGRAATIVQTWRSRGLDGFDFVLPAHTEEKL